MSGDRVEQIVFGWDARNVAFNDGYGPIAFSCDEAEARQVFEETRMVLRPRGVQKWPSLGRRWLSDGRVMVFRRVPTADSAGPPGTVCHALVGDKARLNVPASLGLHYWDWLSPEGPAVGRGLPPLADDWFAEQGVKHRTDVIVDEFVELSLTGPLTTLITHMLLRPEARLLILDDSEGRAPVPLLFMMQRLFGANRLRAFSTFESDDTGGWRAAFVTDWPTTGSADGLRVDPREQVGGDFGDIAEPLLRMTQDEARSHLAEAAGAADPGDRLPLLARRLGRVDQAWKARSNSGYRRPQVQLLQPQPQPQPRRSEASQVAVAGSGPQGPFFRYRGEFSKQSQVFVALRPLIRAYRSFRGSDYVPLQSASEVRISRLDVEQLLVRATDGGPLVEEALRELWRTRAYGSGRDNEDLCRRVLDEHFYLDGHSRDVNRPDSAARVERAVALFDIFVRPRPRGGDNDEVLGEVLVRLWDDYGSVGREVVTRIVRLRPEIGLGETTWPLLFERALQTSPPDTPSAAGLESPPHRDPGPHDTAPHSPHHHDGYRPPQVQAAATAQPLPGQPLSATAGRSGFTTKWRLVIGLLVAWVLFVVVYLVATG